MSLLQIFLKNNQKLAPLAGGSISYFYSAAASALLDVRDQCGSHKKSHLLSHISGNVVHFLSNISKLAAQNQ